MALLYTSPRFLEHDTGEHPERAERLRRVTARLEASGLAARCTRPEWKPVTDEQLARVHSLDYAAQVKKLAEQGGGPIEADTVVSRASYDVARLATGAACDATRRVLTGDDKRALCLLRPPGHHALRDEAMGFCLFNSVAVAARAAIQDHALDRVLIVDWDVHHGNGTQDTFYADEQVGFFSIHRSPFYPGTGASDETGTGRGLGTTRNLPIKFGTSQADYHQRFADELNDFADRMKPQFVLISAGFDAHREDPIGSLGLEVEDFKTLSDVVLDVADRHAEGRVVSLLEGGYHPDRLAESVELHLTTMLERGNEE